MNGGPMRWLLLRVGMALALLAPGAADARLMGVYDYPFVSPLAATVAATPACQPGTADPGREFAQLVEVRYVTPFPERKIPPVFWFFGQSMAYSVLKQSRPNAPLFFIIGGTGAGHDSSKSYGLANVLYQAGFHVVSLPSPTHPSFIVTASSDSVPGQLDRDARDLYRVMDMIADDLADEIGISSYYVGGYSLGGTHAAFVSELDAREKRFNFKKAVVINPAVVLYNSVNRLDDMVRQNLAQDRDAVAEFTEHLFDQVGHSLHLRRSGQLRRPRVPLPGLRDIGTARARARASDRAHLPADLQRHGVHERRHDQCRLRRAQERAAHRDDFAHRRADRGLGPEFRRLFRWRLCAVHCRRASRGVTREELIRRASLYPIESYLRRDPRVVMLGTQDDVILSRDEMLWLEDVFGERARIFPTGGHCGSMDQREFVREMLRLIFDAESRS